MSIKKVQEVIETNAPLFTAALQQSKTGSFLVALPQPEPGAGESLPPEEKFSEKNAPTVVITVRATPTAHENVAALLARFRGDDPKAGIQPDKK